MDRGEKPGTNEAIVDWFPALVAIRRTRDGLVRFYPTWEPIWAGGEPWSDYQWREGNYSCDCNRGPMFAQAGGEKYGDFFCSEEAYFIEKITDERDGSTLWKQGE